ncbi:MAG: hypothetical protein WC344_03200 [Bacilli bacterium]|jgi:hypothetical protein
MKRLPALLLVPLLLLSGCVERYDYTPYYHAVGKGTEVYCWEIGENDFRCGAMPGTNRFKTYDEFQAIQKLPATLSKMREILEYIKIEDPYNYFVSMHIIIYPLPDYGENDNGVCSWYDILSEKDKDEAIRYYLETRLGIVNQY